MRTRSLALACLTLLPTLLAAAWAQPASMMMEVGDTVSFASPLGGVAFPPADSLELDGALYFTSNDGVHGWELWRSDGTGAGTFMLSDVCPGICASFPGTVTAFRHKVYWLASDGLKARLFVSDGTPQGTGPAFGSGLPAGRVLAPMGEVGGRLLLSGRNLDGSKGELWATDGTAAGTVRIGVFRVPASPSLLGRAGGVLVFSLGFQTAGQTLWATDGTTDGTVQLKAGVAGLAFFGAGFGRSGVTAGNRLFFEAVGSTTGNAAWVSDGTAAGTQPLAGFSFDSGLTALGSQVYFVRFTSTSTSLWKSDGTLAGTVLVKDVSSGFPQSLTAVGNRLFFTNQNELWVSDGTEAGTVLVRQFSGLELNGLVALGDRLAFFADDGTHGLQPWVSDGTAAGTLLVAELHPGPASTSGLGVLGGRWLFDARDSQGWFLWASNGTPGNLSKVGPLDVQTFSFLSPLADLNGNLLVFASNLTSGAGAADLWRSDGSAAGTSLVDNLVPVRGADGTLSPEPLAAIGSRLFFSYDFSLWETDGTAAGTLATPATSSQTVEEDRGVKIGGSLYFIASDTHQILVKTDGTDAGTVELHSFDSIPEQLTAVGNRLFFSISVFTNPIHTTLWTSDGTTAGTKPISTRHTFKTPGLWVALGSRLLFTDTDEAGEELWTTDGTDAGTRRLARVAVPVPVRGGGFAFASSLPAGFLAVVGGRIFFPGDDGAHGRELWVTDGTAAGTHSVADIARGPVGSSPLSLTAVGRRVFFTADDGVHGRELWVSDGTAAGTHIVADVAAGAGSSYPASLTAVGGRIVFAADDGVHGLEPWVSDGTRAGTRLLQDIAPGPLPSSPSGFLVSGQSVFFTANDATHGFQLWAMPREALAENP